MSVHRPLAATGVAAVLVMTAAWGSASASATTPDSVEQLREPSVYALEDFQNVSGGEVALLSDYEGEHGYTYTADGYWLNPDYCNGIITSYGTSSADCVNANSNGAEADRNIRRMAHVLGQVQGMSDASENYAISEWTTEPELGSGPVPAPGSVQFRTVKPFDVRAEGRFVSVSIDVAEASCDYLDGVNNSRLKIAVVDGDTEHNLTGAEIIPCQDPSAKTYDAPIIDDLDWGFGGESVKAGTYYTDSSYLFTGSTLGAIVWNMTGAVAGNDSAIDNIQMVDVTPQLDKKFAPVFGADGLATLTFTVTNRTDLAEKEGWSATDNLPEGLVVAQTPRASTSCTNGAIAAVPGSSHVSISGDLRSGEVSCELTVTVAMAGGPSAEARSFTNCADNISDVVGLDLPGCTTVTYEPTSAAGANVGPRVNTGGTLAADAHIEPWAVVTVLSILTMLGLGAGGVVWTRRVNG